MAKILILLLAVSAVRADDGSNGFFRKLLENLRPLMPTGIPEVGVPPLDPLAIPNMTTSIKENDIDLKFKAGGYRVSGLSKFKIDNVEASLKDLTLSIDASLSQLDGDGFYNLKGEYRNLLVERSGRFFVQKERVVFKMTVSLEKTNDILQIKSVTKFQESIGSLQVHLDGQSSDFVGRIGRVIGIRLISQIKSQVNIEIGKAFFNLMDKELEKTPVSKIIEGASPFSPYTVHYSPSANNYIDKLLANVRKLAVQENLDPLKLPDFRAGFSKKILFIRVYGEAKLHSGVLSGLSTIFRGGDANIQASGQGIDLSATLGLRRLVASYRGSAKFMNLGPSIKATVFVDGIRVYLKAAQNLTPGSSPILKEFRITSVGKLAVRIDGLGPLGWILSLLTTGVSNIIKKVIIQKIEGPIGQLIRNELGKISIPISF